MAVATAIPRDQSSRRFGDNTTANASAARKTATVYLVSSPMPAQMPSATYQRMPPPCSTRRTIHDSATQTTESNWVG